MLFFVILGVARGLRHCFEHSSAVNVATIMFISTHGYLVTRSMKWSPHSCCWMAIRVSYSTRSGGGVGYSVVVSVLVNNSPRDEAYFMFICIIGRVVSHRME